MSRLPLFFVLIDNEPQEMRHCHTCKTVIEKELFMGHLRSQGHRDLACRKIDDQVQLIESGFKHRVATYRVCSKKMHILVSEFFNDIKEKVLELISEQILKFHNLKVNVELFGLFRNEVRKVQNVKAFNTKNIVVGTQSEGDQIYSKFSEQIEADVSDFVQNGSGMYFNVTRI